MDPIDNHPRFGELNALKPFPGGYALTILLIAIGILLLVVPILFNIAPIVLMICALIASISWILGAFSAIYAYQWKKAWESHRELFFEIHTCYEQEEFYLMCAKKNIKSLNTESSIARMKKVAENNNINLPEETLIEYFNTGKAFVIELNRSEELYQMDEAEYELYQKNNMYSEYYGNEKRVQMHLILAEEDDEIANEYSEAYDAILKGNKAHYDLLKEKEVDWAIAGGIASGLAGVGAGLSTAVGAQINNADVRQRNSALSESIAIDSFNAIDKIMSNRRRFEESAEENRKKAEASKELLCQDFPPADLLKLIKPKVVSKRKSQTGNILLTVEVKEAELTIYEDVKAVVDGCFKAVLTDGKNNLGEAVFALPIDGSDYTRKLNSVIIEPEFYDSKLKVVFAPIKLWAIEKME